MQLKTKTIDKKLLIYHKGYQLMIHQVSTHTQVFAALIHDKILPGIQDSDGEFAIEDTPISHYTKSL